jgi:hypothetical protein
MFICHVYWQHFNEHCNWLWLFAMFIVNTLDDIVNNYVYLSCLWATPTYINNVCIKCM